MTRVRDRYSRLRAALQHKASKGTRSTRRRCRELLARLSGRERRFQRHTNHVISKALVTEATAQQAMLVLEDLTGIRARTNQEPRTKTERRRGNTWAFYQLRQFVHYKAALSSVLVVLHPPAYTSQMCHACLHLGHRHAKRFTLHQSAVLLVRRRRLECRKEPRNTGAESKPASWSVVMLVMAAGLPKTPIPSGLGRLVKGLEIDTSNSRRIQGRTLSYLRPHAKGDSTPTGAGRYPWAQPGCGSAGMRARRNGSASVKIRRRRKVSGLSTMFRLAPHADTTTALPRAKMPKFTPCLHMTEQLRRNSGVLSQDLCRGTASRVGSGIGGRSRAT